MYLLWFMVLLSVESAGRLPLSSPPVICIIMIVLFYWHILFQLTYIFGSNFG